MSIPQRKLLKEVMTSLCISSIAPFHRPAKSLTIGSTSAAVIGPSDPQLGSSDPLVFTNLIRSLKCSSSSSSSNIAVLFFSKSSKCC
nr:hypothetical protein Iba_scaffold29901CG0010 [Ipomoea batatas]